jgi:outer membrane protein OmpA-like peptidoglycan-associated protein
VIELDERLAEEGDRADRAESRAETLADRLDRAENRAQQAEAIAGEATERAQTEASRREAADAARRTAELDAVVAQESAERAEEAAVAALAEAARVRAERDRELNRMAEALDAIAETQRTALGMVMNLGEDAINFEFDSAELEPEDRELLSRIVGVLLTTSDYRIQVFGHTDDIGSDAYNQRLSERRAEAVARYLVEAGIDPDIITTKGFGKTRPLVDDTTQEARDRNRRVELGIIDSSVEYQGVSTGEQRRP